ncbi:RNA-binding protein [Thioclava sp. SK-1]|uniref:RNA-binding S4 domain-containing protein n=1 Tax=Thioclava sp. SK-1 TaxID=1889770 RepID=UPI0008241E43|nr:RNA-binding S4 domain-containing protein [Thioclava sp. SK-1]OCX62795.1 RNA-binding protein [Thioclava sp. SK-1]
MAADDRIRIDKWLWQARFYKTRVLSSQMVQGGKLRVNGQKMLKPGRAVGPGDALTFKVHDQIRTLRIVECGTRRGPATEAQTLYEWIDGIGSETSVP